MHFSIIVCEMQHLLKSIKCTHMATVILSIVGLQKKTLIRYWVNLYLHSEHKNQFYITGKKSQYATDSILWWWFLYKTHRAKLLQ